LPRRGLAFLLTFVLYPFLSIASITFAADASNVDAGAVTGIGTAKVERRPDFARIQFDLSAEGKDVKEALAKLREKEKALRDKLAKLGLSEGAIKVDEPRMGLSAQDQQAQMERMVQMRTGRAAKKPTTNPSQPSVTVMVHVRAEWKLAAQNTDDLLIEAQELSAKVKSADLIGKQDAKKTLTPEEQELEEERAMLLQQSGQAAPADADNLPLMFVSRVSEEERAKLLAEAFGKAKEDATRLAKAAGGALGPIRQLTSAANAQGESDASERYNEYMYQRRMMGQQMPGAGGEDPAEAVSMTPGKITYRVMVTAAFAMK
jgi:uncharacterized protein YggE